MRFATPTLVILLLSVASAAASVTGEQRHLPSLPSDRRTPQQSALSSLHEAQVLLKSAGTSSTSALTSRGGATAKAPAKAVAKAPAGGAGSVLKVGFYFFMWYLLNIVYNISNKKVLNALPLPITVACAQLGMGLLWILPVWLLKLRPVPKMAEGALPKLSKIAAFHTLGHAMTVVSLGAGAVSFTHIVKAAEPFFSTIMSALFLGSTFPWQVYATLLPIVAGVSIASMKELSFSWVSFLNAMGSNTAFSLRAIFSKKEMTSPPGQNFSPANLYAVLTIISFIGILPVALLSEGSRVGGALKAGISLMGSEKAFWTQVLTSGLSYYLYNEVAFLALGEVHPITHAVGNTIKRVVVLVASVIAFGTTMQPLAIFGSAMAVAGTLLYSLAKQKYA